MCRVNPDWENIHSKEANWIMKGACANHGSHMKTTAYNGNMDGTREPPPQTKYNLLMPKFMCKKHEAIDRCNMYRKTHTPEHVETR